MMKKKLISIFCLVWLVAPTMGYAAKANQDKKGPEQVSDNEEREARLAQALNRFAREPTIQEVMDESVRYYKVQPEILSSLRRNANMRALLPVFSARYGYGYDTRDRTLDDNLVPLASREHYETGAHGVSATMSWDFPTLVFNPAELQTYALTGIRINVLKEVSRIYFIRRQILLQIIVKPPEDPLARVGLEQRVLEFTALIDSFTGGYFTNELKKRGLADVSKNAAK